MTIKMTTPEITNAREFVGDRATNKIPLQSVVRNSKNRLMIVERSNGFVLSGREQDTNQMMVIDLRNEAAEIVSIATWVEETPEPTPPAPAKAKAVKLSAAPEITVIQPKTAHQIEGWAIEIYRKAAPNYAVVAIQRGSRVLSLRRNKCQAIFATPEAAIAAWNLIDWEVTIDKNGAVYRVVRRSFLGFHKHLLETPAPVVTDAARPQPAPIVYRDLVRAQPFSNRYDSAKMISANSRYCGECGREMALRGSQERGYCGKCYSVWYAQSTVTATPASTVSPALATSERVIAVPTVAPLALDTRTLSINGTHVRVTKITDKSFAVEELSAGGYGGFENVGNYATQAQVDNAIARITRESQPTPVEVKPARYSPCALTVQWQSIPLLPAPVVKPEAPAKPADVRMDYKCHSLAAVYGLDGRNDWTCYANGPVVFKGVYTRFHSAESAIASAKATIDRKASAGIKKGYHGL